MANIHVCCMAMTPEASGSSSTQPYMESMLSSIRQVGASFYGDNCKYEGAVGFLYAARDPRFLIYIPQYVRYLVKSEAIVPHTVLIMRSLLDISTDMDVATRMLVELGRLDMIDEVFVSGISEQLPFVDYVGDIRRYYGLPETMKPMRLRMPAEVVSFADRMQAQGLPYSDIYETLMVTKSQIQAYRKSGGLGGTYTSYYRRTVTEKQREQFLEECRSKIKQEFRVCFSTKKLDILGDYSIAHTIYGGSKLL